MQNILLHSLKMTIICSLVLFLISCGKEQKLEKPSKKQITRIEVKPIKVASPSEVKIGVIQLNENDDFDSALKINIERESKNYGSEVLFYFNGLDPGKHLECVRKLIVDEGVHVLIADSPTFESFNETVEIAKTKGTYVINTGTQKTIQRQPLVVQFMGKDNTEGGYKIGSTTGRLISGEFNGQGNVIILDMPEDNLKYKDRASSFRTGLNQYAFEAEVVTTFQGSESVEESQRIVGDLLKQYPEANVIYSVCKESTLGALKACQAAGKDPGKFVITGYDATKEIFNSIKASGFVRAVLVDQPDEIARIMVLAAIDLATGKRDLKEYQLQSHWVLTVLVTIDNIDEWIE